MVLGSHLNYRELCLEWRPFQSTVGTNNEKGSGLGLLLRKEFVEMNGGRFWIESETGRGSNFIFTLPDYI